jgi:predicted CoA-substrate-specific enzyme activase
MSTREAFVGVDVGSASVKIAGVDADRCLVGSPVYVRIAHHPSPIDALKAAFSRFLETLPAGARVAGVGTTGSGRELTRHILRADLTRTEIFAHAAGLMYVLDLALLPRPGAMAPGTIIEIGGQDSKVVVFENGVPVYFNMNSICSAGTGEFLQQLADEIGLPVAAIGETALAATHPPQIDATCTVFIKRDFRHLTQKGVPLADRLMGICQAMVANYLRNVVGSGGIPPPYYFQGGVAGNAGVRAAFEARLGHPVTVPPYYDVMGAIGMAVTAAREATGAGPSRFDEAFLQRTFESRICFCHGCHNNCEITEPLERAADGTARALDRLGGRCERSQDPRNLHAAPAPAAKLELPMRRHPDADSRLEIFAAHRPVRRADGAYFGGIDGGSRGTKYAAIRCVGDDVEVVGVETLETGGDAIAAITAAVAGLRRMIPEGAVLGGIGTTGSAGELARDIVSTGTRHCADYLSTEILAHFAWATWLFPGAATVMDIGGNDAKIIVRRDGALEFAMNDKCAAGTGAFIEAVAKRFRVPLTSYGTLALASRSPARVAGRCAVFGESDLVHKSRMGYPTADLLLGVAFAICRTYLSDVAKGRELGLPIVVQGGAFLNDAVVAAFREVLGLDEASLIRHPDRRYVIGAGALGAALLARLRYEEGHGSAFKGFEAVAARRYETAALDCSHPTCGRRCPGVVALLEDGIPIAGYRSIDCPVGMFEGLIRSEQEAGHVQALLARRSTGWREELGDGAQDRDPSGAHLSLSVDARH